MYFKLLLQIYFLLVGGALWAADAAHIVFTAGDATVAGRPARVGDTVREGELLTTRRDGYLYLETLDKGFFILRPNSVGQIVTYHIDALNPANTRIKLELTNGVARHISGEAVKSARQNFRFNTPVAAIGVRGTDFTVFANDQISRIAVLSGGVIVSPLVGSCLAGGTGPCDGPASRELFASATSQVLQIAPGQAPILLQGLEHAPDAMTPPRPGEPSASKTGARNPASAAGAAATLVDMNPDALKTIQISQSASPPVLAPLPSGPPQLVWGRWQALLDQPIEVDVKALQTSNQLIATNGYFALMRTRDGAWQAPAQTALGFALQQSQAVILDEASRLVTPVKIENGLLQINFANASFFTRFDLVNQSERIQLQNSGELSTDGKLYGGYQFMRPNNMDVRGALANDNSTAAYLFQARLDDHRLASGATYWGK